MLLNTLKNQIKKILDLRKLENIKSNVIELNNINELKKIFNFKLEPIINDPEINNFEYIEDANERRLRDAEVIATICRNVNSGNMLEIGTAEGHSTALMAQNASNAKIFTINIPPEEIISGSGGINITKAYTRNEIGKYYKQLGLTNITQIFENTSKWNSDTLEKINVAFIDGCHDADFVYNDTCKALKRLNNKGFILWHDFNPELANIYNWINDVCIGVEKLYREKKIKGKIFHVKDSWIGVYQISE